MTTPRPISNRTIVVTRSRDQSGRLASLLEAEGAHVIEFPTIDIRPVPNPPQIGVIGHYDWILFTSGNSVRYFFEALPALNVEPDFAGVKVGAVGPATRETLEKHGVTVNLVPDENTAEVLIEALEETEPDLNAKRILLPRGNLADDLLPDRLRASGADVSVAIFYRTVMPDVSEEGIDKLLAAKPDAITFTSASTASNFASILGPARLRQFKKGTVIASIGPQTSAAIRAVDLPVTVEADPHTLEGLVGALHRAFNGLRSRA